MLVGLGGGHAGQARTLFLGQTLEKTIPDFEITIIYMECLMICYLSRIERERDKEREREMLCSSD
jgi:hypothetical protein